MTSPIDILKNWNITGEIEDISHTGYSGSDIFKIKSADKTYILKGYPAKLSVENIRKTHEILDIAHQNNFHFLPYSVKTQNGDCAFNANAKVWDVVTFVLGSHLIENPTPSALANLSQTIAQFHIATKEVKIDQDIRHGNPISLQKIQDIFDWWNITRKTDKDKLLKAGILTVTEEFMDLSITFFEQSMKKFDWIDSFEKLPRCIVHSDLTKRNILFKNDEVTGIIDLESVRYNSRLLDIVRLAMEFTNASHDKVNKILQSYEEISPLQAYEKDNSMLYLGVLNTTVNLWTVKNYISLHLQNSTNLSDFTSKIHQAIGIYKML